MSDEKPEIFVDEDWKSQVEKEKQQAAEKIEEVTEEIGEDGIPAQPDPNFTIFDSLTSGLAAQTMVALGLTGEEDQEVQVDLGYAHHLIGTLVILQEKTAGNLEEGEAANLEEAIGELTRVFSIREDQIREMQEKDDAKPDLRILGND
jgi:hypothetical protein